MIDQIATGISLTKEALGFLGQIKDIVGAEVISAYFKWDGNKVEGSDKIKIETSAIEDVDGFWLNVESIEDYTFVHFPINSSGCEELIATTSEPTLPDPNYWRWVQAARSGTIVGGNYTPPNAKVDFVVVGYKPKALIQYLSSQA